MACPSDFMPGKLTQQQVELRCGYYTEQCLQQLEQCPELAKLRELKKQERLAQQAKQAKAAILLFLLAFTVLVCGYCGSQNPLQVHSFRLTFAGWCCCYQPGASAKHPTAAKHQKSIQRQSVIQFMHCIMLTSQVSHRRNTFKASLVAPRLLSLWSSSTLQT